MQKHHHGAGPGKSSHANEKGPDARYAGPSEHTPTAPDFTQVAIASHTALVAAGVLSPGQRAQADRCLAQLRDPLRAGGAVAWLTGTRAQLAPLPVAEAIEPADAGPSLAEPLAATKRAQATRPGSGQRPPMPWFRAYSELVDDEKLRLLEPADRWFFVALLCLKCARILDEEPNLSMLRRKVSVKLGLTVEALLVTVKRLADVRLVDFETLQPLAWERRQFKSDSSKARVQAFRQRKLKKKMKRYGNVTVTAQDSDSDSEGFHSRPKAASMKTNFGTSENRAGSLGVTAQQPKTRDSKAPKPEIDLKPPWVVRAGFLDIDDAKSSACFEHNSSEFSAGKRKTL